MTTAAVKATAAADALLAWLRDQPAACVPSSGVGGATGGEMPPSTRRWTTPPPPGLQRNQPARTGRSVTRRVPRAPSQCRRQKRKRRRHCRGRQRRSVRVMSMAPRSLAPIPTGYTTTCRSADRTPPAAFQIAAAGAGVIPWHLDLDRLAEDCFHRLVAPPPPPQLRRLSVAGARILAGQLRDAVARRHDLAVARVGRSRACPFDLHALVPCPADILRRGPDDPVCLQWLWEHWGTTGELRHVTTDPVTGEAGGTRQRVRAESAIGFWSADWSPWRALARVAALPGPRASRLSPRMTHHDRRRGRAGGGRGRQGGPVVRLGGRAARGPGRHGTASCRSTASKVRSTGCWRLGAGQEARSWRNCRSPR